jgi:uncharacterized protein (DUF2237 family)
VQFALAAREQCGSPPTLQGQSIETLISQNQGNLLIAIPNMRCTNAIKAALKKHKIEFKDVIFQGQFKFAENNPVWHWLNCKYPNDKLGNTIMHSYFFHGGEFVGEGFAAEKQVDANPAKFATSKTVDQFVAEKAWSEAPDANENTEQGHSADEKSGKSQKGCSTVSDARTFIKQYNNIFKTRNRNAASHLWSSYLIERSACLDEASFTNLFEQFCAISGSPLGRNPARSCYVSQHPLASDASKMVQGQEHHCCAPCYCDARDWTVVDTKTIALKDGKKKAFNFFVIGDPCEKGGIPDNLKRQAPELGCNGQKLKGAMRSDHGKVIIGMFFPATSSAQCAMGPQEEQKLDAMCQDRAQSGDKSGMGKIFIDLAKINPVVSPSNKKLVSAGQQGSEHSTSNGKQNGGGSPKNVKGGPLQLCSQKGMALTGFTRNGKCMEKNDDTGSHHICIDLKKVGSQKDFCQVTGQPDWCAQSGTCFPRGPKKCPRENWCVCQWAFCGYLARAGGCNSIQKIVCDAVNMAALDSYKKALKKNPKAMMDGGSIADALACLKSKCGLK